MIGPQLAGVLDDHDSLPGVDQAEHRRQQRRFAAAGAAGDEEGCPSPDEVPQQGGPHLGEGAAGSIIRKLATAHPTGLAASKLNDNPEALPNTYMTLDKLALLELVRVDDQVHPKRFYLGPRILE